MGKAFLARSQNPQWEDSGCPQCESVPSALAVPLTFAVRQDGVRKLDWKYPSSQYAKKQHFRILLSLFHPQLGQVQIALDFAENLVADGFLVTVQQNHSTLGQQGFREELLVVGRFVRVGKMAADFRA